MCRCHDHIKIIFQNALFKYNEHVLHIDDVCVVYKCFAYTLAYSLCNNPAVGVLLPRKMLINGKPILVEYGTVKCDTFYIDSHLTIYHEDELD
uniref:NS6 protein n=1 Tax=Bird deltacoronavirus AnasCN24 TaxID=3237947 RepID=A0AB39AG73_9NIDO